MTDLPPDVAPSKVTRARAVTVGAADPTQPRRRHGRVMTDTPDAPDADAVVARTTTTTAEPTGRSVSIQQGGIAEATAATIDIHQGGIASAKATDIAVSQGGIALAKGDTVSLEIGALGIAVADQARLSQTVSYAVIAKEATVEQALTGTLIAESVTVRQPSFVGIILASRVDGEVRALLDWRGALAAGAVIGILLGILRRR